MRLGDLFEHRDLTWPRPGYDDELQAVASGKKAISMIELGDGLGDDDHLELLERALALGLHTIHQPDTHIPNHPSVIFYAMHPAEVWRAQALMLLNKTSLEHLDAIEEVQSRLLGYSEDDIRSWRAAQRWHGLPGGRTIMFLMTVEQRAKIAEVGDACIAPWHSSIR